MRISVITPSYNSKCFLETTVKSVLQQRESGVDLEYIVLDGGSDDGSLDILEKYRAEIDQLVVERDTGPANALNKGLSLATGEVVAWLNADDIYFPETLKRVALTLSCHPNASFCFGRCPIVDEEGKEIRTGITRFKEIFFPVSSAFTHQCINYLSQPALFFTRSAVEAAGPLREDMVAAWDYEYFLRLWRYGGGVRMKGDPLAAFRWHSGSISGQHFKIQFQEEYEAAKADAGALSMQTGLHYCVRWGIVAIYSLMSTFRERSQRKLEDRA